MRHSLPISALIACGLLAACSSTPEHSPQDGSAGDGRCDAEAVQYLLDQRITTELAEKARKQAGAKYLRVTQPNQPVTMDYNAQRLNIDIDDADSIIRLSCG